MRDAYTRCLAPRARELRNHPTPAERKLWFEFLRIHPVKFRRQVPLQGYILDFYAPVLKLCIELDGRSHDGQAAQQYDAERTRRLTASGIRVVRFSNAEVLGQFAEACATIDGVCRGEAPF
ncbi:endonuclease domain-containing protein [Deinococcus metallilatus]|uniref:Endonuclease domain-containing protein n=1 Tax=Deinococcus metallilatus TaxID=1211322 RepID=A0AAJ5F3P7_9DEIO|nr:endonuclease domain-containing protein [Deinococcus metallilatus]MBB5294884.1 very-short-patch-repair endonuclease [Deinococcus metallilatus]QBY09403.1 endonuclease domain-containing protein [Deinococcus metallilatus]RXJ09409.1 endonuclease domain-containing protein [Deinococcus metallilatus]TLK28931.1 endonuclease domain-containing protein [Deinococcus metallilatus]GMA16813.1 endonuclease [Deinococcus metallilatus]